MASDVQKAVNHTGLFPGRLPGVTAAAVWYALRSAEGPLVLRV